MHVHFRGGEKLIPDNERGSRSSFATHQLGSEMGGDFTPTVRQWRDEIAQGKRLGRALLPAVRKLDGPSRHGPVRFLLPTRRKARRAVETLQQMGAGFVSCTFPRSERTPTRRSSTRRTSESSVTATCLED